MARAINRIFAIETDQSGATTNGAHIHFTSALRTQISEDNLAPRFRTYLLKQSPPSTGSQCGFKFWENFPFRPASIGAIGGQDQNDPHNQHHDRNQNPKIGSNDKPGHRPLVLLYSWLLAEDYQLEKYRHFWNSRGYDILTIRTRKRDFLNWTYSCKNAQKVREFIAQTQPKYLIVHGFCGGNFQFLELLHQLLQRLPSSSSVLDRIKCLVIDSITLSDDGYESTGKVLSDHRPIQIVIKYFLIAYYWLAQYRTLTHLIALEALLRENPRKYPTLLLYSRDDDISDYAKMDALADRWSRDRVRVRQKCWHSSPHVRHYRFHRAEYEREVDSFLREINIVTE